MRSSHCPSLPDWLFAHNKGMGFGNWVALILIRETLNKIYLEIALIGSPTPWSSRAGLMIHFFPSSNTHTHTQHTPQKLMLFNLVIRFVLGPQTQMHWAQVIRLGLANTQTCTQKLQCCIWVLSVYHMHWHRWLNSKWIHLTVRVSLITYSNLPHRCNPIWNVCPFSH